MAVGNSCGFVEPLESTSLMVICWQLQTFVEMIRHVGPSDGMRDLFNKTWADTWDELRDFLALHFWGNTRLDTPYWRHCRADTDISRVKPLLEFYQANGPAGYGRYYLANTGSQFGIEGFLTMLVGMKVPYQNRHAPTDAERQIVNQRRMQHKAAAEASYDVKEALACIRHPSWRWFSEIQS